MNDALKKFVDEVRAVYAPVVTGPASRIDRGDILWGQFEIAVAACDSRASDSARKLTERVNEMVVAKILADDPLIADRIAYEPDFLPHGRRIDFFTSCNEEKLHVEVKTVHPQAPDDDEPSWREYLRQSEFNPPYPHFDAEREWMSGALYGNRFSARFDFLEYALDFEVRLADAKTIGRGSGILVFCGNGFAWNRSDLEDFVDFYRSRIHRPDDALALMEQCYIKDEDIHVRRNIDHFACLTRPAECALPIGFACPVVGPRLASPGSLMTGPKQR